MATLRGLPDVYGLLVDESVGLVGQVIQATRYPGDPLFFHFGAVAGRTSAFSPDSNSRIGSGASATRDAAIAKAVGEAVERYCSAIYYKSEMPVFPYDRREVNCVRPGEFALHSGAQYECAGFPFRPFTESTPARWVAGVDVLTGDVWHVPAAFVYVPYRYSLGDGEVPIAEPISTGLACHSQAHRAILNGLCEVVERDAFTITWQAMISPPRVNLRTLSPTNRDRVDRFKRAHCEVMLFDITTDVGIPTILGVLRAPEGALPALVFAAAASMDPQEAAMKSLEELAHTRLYMKTMAIQRGPSNARPPYDDVVRQTDHLQFWADPAKSHHGEFVFGSLAIRGMDELASPSTGHPRTDLERAASLVRGTQHRVICIDVTTPDVASLGIVAVRVVIPGYHPLFIGHSVRALGGDRLWTVPQRLGYPGIKRVSGGNPAPHPYP